jgi:hypothetical protein
VLRVSAQHDGIYCVFEDLLNECLKLERQRQQLVEQIPMNANFAFLDKLGLLVHEMQTTFWRLDFIFHGLNCHLGYQRLARPSEAAIKESKLGRPKQ